MELRRRLPTPGFSANRHGFCEPGEASLRPGCGWRFWKPVGLQAALRLQGQNGNLPSLLDEFTWGKEMHSNFPSAHTKSSQKSTCEKDPGCPGLCGSVVSMDL